MSFTDLLQKWILNALIAEVKMIFHTPHFLNNVNFHIQ